MKKGILICLICGRERDAETKLCPTPEACEELKRPHARRRNVEKRDHERATAAAREHADIGVCRPPLPPEVRAMPSTWRRRRAS